jgi:cytochrome c oxidase assembly protein subunit 15
LFRIGLVRVKNSPPQLESPWPHRLAVALECTTFPMIWIGGLVTSYGAGMAVPDWPNTYGYNLFLYPWETWVYGPWKLFIEHGHRLFGTLIGMITIAFLISAWRCQTRPVVRWLGVAALVGVLFQGALGGMRVIVDQVQLAKIHGCVGPAFFALTVALAAVTSRRWQEPGEPSSTGTVRAGMARIERLAVLTTLLAYAQLVVGSQLRHLPTAARAGDFRIALWFHLVLAAALFVHIVFLAARIYRAQPADSWLRRPAARLLFQICLQVTLGACTWIVKYGWPAWMSDFGFAAAHVVSADSFAQILVATAHVAIGSLILATSLLVALRSARLAHYDAGQPKPATWVLEGAR